MTDGRFLKKSALTEEKLVKIRELNGLQPEEVRRWQRWH